MKTISLKITIMTLFVFLAIVIISSMSYIQISHSKNTAQKVVREYFDILSHKVNNSFLYADRKNISLVFLMASFFDNLNSIEEIEEDRKEYLKFFTQLLTQNPNFYSFYLGFKDSSFFEVINLKIDKRIHKKYAKNPNDRWAVIEINTKDLSKRTFMTFDKTLQKTSSTIEENHYKVAKRSWFKKAIVSEDPVKSDPYFFKMARKKGVTYSKKIFKKDIVISIDVLSHDLNKILQDQKNNSFMETFILSKNQTVLASTTEDETIVKEIFNHLKPDGNFHDIRHHTYQYKGKKYIVNIEAIKNPSDNFIISYIPLEKAIEPYTKTLQTMVLSIMVVTILALPLIIYFSNIIIRPILSLKQESIKVENRQFSSIKKVGSFIYEIQILSDAIIKMSNAIQDHQNNLEQKIADRTKALKEKNDQLKTLSITDKLTNIFNRIKLDRTIEKEIEKSNQENSSFGFIILDIDFFKQVNDTYGHQTGDTTLIEIAKILKKHSENIGIAGRWGGEEFVIVTPDTNLPTTLQIAQTIRQEIESYNFPVIHKKTASFGVASYQKGETQEDLINRADKALYLAKREGRNRVKTIENELE